MPRVLPLVACLALMAPVPRLWGQGPWSVVLTGGAVGFSTAASATVEDVNEPDGFKPSATTRFRIGVARNLGRFEAQVSYGYLKAGLASTGEVSVIFVPAFTLHELALQLGYRLAQLPSGALARARVGPMLQLWEGDLLDETRSEAGIQAGLSIEAPLSGHVMLVADGTLGVAGSFFRPEDLDGLNISYEATNLWSYELAVGVRYRF